MKRLMMLLLFVLQTPGIFAQERLKKEKKSPAAPLVLKIISNEQEYLRALKRQPELRLVDLKKEIPSLVLDIRYATTNNFMKLAVYKQARAFARKPVAMQLKKVQQELKKKGYGLKIYDAYRPYSATKTLYLKAKNKNFVANPKKGSRHNRGCAIDLTIINLKTGRELAMPTPYDSFSAQASATYGPLPVSIAANRDLLIRVMQAHGFTVLTNEWWHFDFNTWRNYDLMDIPFERL